MMSTIRKLALVIATSHLLSGLLYASATAVTEFDKEMKALLKSYLTSMSSTTHWRQRWE